MQLVAFHEFTPHHVKIIQKALTDLAKKQDPKTELGEIAEVAISRVRTQIDHCLIIKLPESIEAIEPLLAGKRPCCSPYCECTENKCRNPECFDARQMYVDTHYQE